jgi:amino acid transporter
MNVSFVVLAYLVGMAVDWILQLDWQATNKSRWGRDDNKWVSVAAVVSHSFVYALITTLAVVLLLNLIPEFWFIFLTFFVTHTLIDTRIPVKWIMKYIKRMSDEQIADYQNYSFMHIGIDHRLHELVIVVLGFMVT